MGERSIVFSVSVCLSVREHISGSPFQSAPNLLRMLGLPIAVARSSSGGVTTCYAFPFLRMTSLFEHNGQE